MVLDGDDLGQGMDPIIADLIVIQIQYRNLGLLNDTGQVLHTFRIDLVLREVETLNGACILVDGIGDHLDVLRANKSVAETQNGESRVIA